MLFPKNVRPFLTEFIIVELMLYSADGTSRLQRQKGVDSAALLVLCPQFPDMKSFLAPTTATNVIVVMVNTHSCSHGFVVKQLVVCYPVQLSRQAE